MNKKKTILIFSGILITVVLIIALITALGSGGNKYKKLPSGLEYKIVINNSKEKVKQGDMMKAYITYKTGKDSVVFSTYSTANKSTFFPVGESKNIGDMNEAFLLLGSKDSAIFRLPSDSIFKGNSKRPKFAGKGTYIVIGIRVDTVLNSESFKKMQYTQSEKQKLIDEELIKKYLIEKNISAKKSADGIYYVIEKNGAGKNASAGDEVSVLYTGMLLNGSIFDSSEKNGGAPFKFKIDSHSVIQGWDEGLKYFNKGAIGKLIIPSTMAYGEKEYAGLIPANSVLIFQIELKDIK